jgi:hypothetical protein
MEYKRVEVTDEMYAIIDAVHFFEVPARELPDNWLQFITISFNRLTEYGLDYGSAMSRIIMEMQSILGE